MIAQCPKCKSIFEIDDSLVPPKGRYARCSVCRDRFFISPAQPRPNAPQPDPSPVIKAEAVQLSKKPSPAVRPKPARPAPAKAPVKPPKKKHTPYAELKLTRYQRIFKRLAGYYASKDNGYKYEISVFCFAYKEIPTTQAVAREVDELRKMIEKNTEDLKRYRSPEDDHHINRLKDEINRHQGLIKIFGDLLKFQKEFKTKGIDVSINQILAVLKDVEVGMTGR